MADDAARLGKMMLRHYAAALRGAAAAAEQGGEEVASVMRATAPRDDLELVRSIRVEQATSIKTRGGEKDFVGVIVKAGDESTIVTNSHGIRFQNAKLQETGTKKMPASPYFNPSWRLMKSRVKSRVTRALKKGWLKG